MIQIETQPVLHTPPPVPRRATPPACAQRTRCLAYEGSGDVACHACLLVLSSLSPLPAE